MHPPNHWGWEEVLLNKATHLLEVLAWQKTKDAQKRMPANAPKLFVPDFMNKTAELNKDAVVQDVDAVKAILARPRA